jgi:hypothetical protein
MISDKGIQGFKQSEFNNGTPEKVFGSDFRIEELPEGIRLYLKEKAIDVPIKKLVINIYRLVDDGSLKNKKVWVGKIVNKKPEEEEIAERYGGGSYIWVGRWLAADGAERGVISEPIEIDEDMGKKMNEAWLRKQAAVEASAQPAQPAVVQSVAPSSFGSDAATMLKIMDAAEEKTLSRIERIASIFQGRQNDTPGDVLNKAYQGASEMMQRAVQTNLDMAKAVNKANQLALQPPDAKGDEEDEEVMSGPKMPSWLSPFMPHLEKGIGKLLEGGPMGNAVKTLILSSDEWSEIFNDKEKWGQAVSAMEQHFGSEQTRQALDILLSRNKKKGRK